MKVNYNYAKLVNGKLEYAPNKLIVSTEQVFNAPAEVYFSKGWLPIVKKDMPENGDGYYFTPAYTEVDGKIIQQWEKVEIPETYEATESDYINALEDLGVNFNE